MRCLLFCILLFTFTVLLEILLLCPIFILLSCKQYRIYIYSICLSFKTKPYLEAAKWRDVFKKKKISILLIFYAVYHLIQLLLCFCMQSEMSLVLANKNHWEMSENTSVELKCFERKTVCYVDIARKAQLKYCSVSNCQKSLEVYCQIW